jgi:hypothetical protein
MEQPFEEKVVTEESVVVTKRGRKPKEESVDVEAVEETVNPNYQVSATDLIATLYTYAPSPVKKGNFKQAGKCLLCGVPTAAVERKICWECLQKHRDDIVTR